jgi:hypothetical protein
VVYQPSNGDLPKDAARGILPLNFSEADKVPLGQVLHASNEGELSAAEREELESYVLVGDVLSLPHLKAKKSLKS